MEVIMIDEEKALRIVQARIEYWKARQPEVDWACIPKELREVWLDEARHIVKSCAWL